MQRATASRVVQPVLRDRKIVWGRVHVRCYANNGLKLDIASCPKTCTTADIRWASNVRRDIVTLTAAVGPAAASKEDGDAFHKSVQKKNNQRGAEAQHKRQQK